MTPRELAGALRRQLNPRRARWQTAPMTPGHPVELVRAPGLTDRAPYAYAAVAHAVKSAGGKPRARVMDLWIAATALVLR